MGTLLRVYVGCCRGNLLIAVVRFVGLYIIVTYLWRSVSLYSFSISTTIGFAVEVLLVRGMNHYWIGV